MFESYSDTSNMDDAGSDLDNMRDHVEMCAAQDADELGWIPEDELEQPENPAEEMDEGQAGQYTLEVRPDDPASGPDLLHSRGFKIAAASAAALGVIGLSGLAHLQKAGEVAEYDAPAPVVEQVETDETTLELSQDQESTSEDAAGQRTGSEEERAVQDSHRDIGQMSEQIETQEIQDSWWHDVPVISQHGLQYADQDTAYGCTPTATSMVLDYWHAQDPANQALPAQELLNLNAAEGEFHARGMSITDMQDELQELGYSVVQEYRDSNLETLKSEVAKGPVVATVKLNMAASGNNHSVVVTGISEDDQVRINDPWTGQAHTYTWDEFSRSWGADYGPGASRNNFTAIRPL